MEETRPLCSECGRLQPLPRGVDLFRVLGLQRRLDLQSADLEPRFHALSREYHPDRYRVGRSRERLIALENSSLLNRAYRTLRDPFERAMYLLELEEGRKPDGKHSPPAAWFEEILEIQELLEEFSAADEAGRSDLRDLLTACRARLRDQQARQAAELTGPLFARWDRAAEAGEGGDGERRAVLAEIRRLLDERAYLRRLLDRLDQALGEA
ncbi:MAG: Fe-S protein assembly co-chaperone HscB [Armatimonadetes bacterium]|nr:Fe-S protein assembly co-chaperone HscB [Armatimonadota bacterium]